VLTSAVQYGCTSVVHSLHFAWSWISCDGPWLTLILKAKVRVRLENAWAKFDGNKKYCMWHASKYINTHSTSFTLVPFRHFLLPRHTSSVSSYPHMPPKSHKRRKVSKNPPQKELGNPFGLHPEAAGAVLEFLDLPGLGRFGSLCKSAHEDFLVEFRNRIQVSHQRLKHFETNLGLLRDGDDNTPYSFLSKDEYSELRSATKMIKVSRRLGRSLRPPREAYCMAEKFGNLISLVVTTNSCIPTLTEPLMIKDSSAIATVRGMMVLLKSGDFSETRAISSLPHYPLINNYFMGEIRRSMYKVRPSSKEWHKLLSTASMLLLLYDVSALM